MKKNILILIIIITSLITSCDSIMDVEPKGFMIPSKAEHLRMLLDNTTGNYSNPRPVSVGYNLVQFAGDQAFFNESDAMINLSESAYSYYMRDVNLITTHNHGDIILMSESLALFNSVLDILPKTTDLSDISRNQIKGEALTHRAYVFLTLVNIHGVHYDSNTASSDKGIPMLLSSDINMSVPAISSVDEVYKKIVADLTEACDLLEPLSINRALPCKASAYALLARTYLYMGLYDKALEYANKSLDITSFLYDYKSFYTPNNLNVPTRQFDSKEVLLDKKTGSAYSPRVRRYVSDEFISLYIDGDLRKNYFEEYRGKYYYVNYPYTFSGILTSEMYLIKSECNARKGYLTEALRDLNNLRRNRFTSENYVELNSSDKNIVLDWVLRERRLELVWTGLRWFDMKRLNKEDRYKKRLRRVYGTKVLELEPNTPEWAFPFPSNILVN